MANEIELVSDGEGVVVLGDSSAVKRFLTHAGLTEFAEHFEMSRLNSVLKTSAETLSTVSDMVEQSGMYLKLTPESAKRLKDAGGLMKTKTKGISHAMLGETGKKSLKWLQVEDGVSALATNPAVLSGLGSLMTQFAKQTEANELQELLVRIDEKLDDVRRQQRDDVLGRMKSAAAAIEDAMIIHHQGGDPKTLWDKVNGELSSIFSVQESAMHALEALADKVESKNKPGQVKSIFRDIDQEVALQLSILTRCFELHDMFTIVELDHVLDTAPQHLDGHRRGIADARAKRQQEVLGRTRNLMERLDRAGAIVNENIILHAPAARSVIKSLNATAGVVEDFHAPLGIELKRAAPELVPWREAIRDSDQRRTAVKEAGKKAAAAGAGVAAVALLVNQNSSRGSSSRNS